MVGSKTDESEAKMNDVDRKFMEMAVAEAAKSRTEGGKITPKVGAVIARGCDLIASAHRGEIDLGEHAEYTALERKCHDVSIAGATVFTTLEPCTTRHPPKIPCVERLLQRKIGRVMIGMLDPNATIRGRGLLALRRANVEVCLFPNDLMAQIEELNRDFIRQQEELGREILDVSDPTPKPQSSLLLDISDSFLGLSGQGVPGNIVEVTVGGFQASLINVGNLPVRKISGELRPNSTNESFPLFLIRDGWLVPPTEMLALPPGRRAMIFIPFDRTNPTSMTRLELPDLTFLENFPPFTVTVESEYGSDSLEVSLERCEAVIRRIIDGDSHQGPLWRTSLAARAPFSLPAAGAKSAAALKTGSRTGSGPES